MNTRITTGAPINNAIHQMPNPCSPYSKNSAGIPVMLTALSNVAKMLMPTAHHGSPPDATKNSRVLCCSLTNFVATTKIASR